MNYSLFLTYYPISSPLLLLVSLLLSCMFGVGNPLSLIKLPGHGQEVIYRIMGRLSVTTPVKQVTPLPSATNNSLVPHGGVRPHQPSSFLDEVLPGVQLLCR